MAILPAFVKAILDFEDSPLRFERLCIELYRQAEGVELVPTSRTWDRGRDARGISTRSGRPLPGVLCATLSADLDEKVAADIQRLADTTDTEAIIYCTSRRLTEQACDKLETAIRRIYPKARAIRVMGQIQIAALAERYEESFRRNYAAELQNIEDTLLRPTTPEPEQTGLRLALMTQTGDDASALRRELARRLILETIKKQGIDDPGRLAVSISGALHLSRSLSSHYVRGVFRQLQEDGLLVIDGDKATLSPAGEQFLSEAPAQASSKLMEGRTAVREAIKRLSGHALTDSHYDTIWALLQDGLADLFYSHGAAIVRMMGGLISGEEAAVTRTERELLERLGDRIAQSFTSEDQGLEVRQAVLDMFAEKETAAFEWLTQVCSVYVMMCSLGFETLSAAEITRVLQKFRLVPDTDIVLSLLAEREDNHNEIEGIMRAWRALGGGLLTASPVLEETAYHAWISDRDHGAMGDQFANLSVDEARHLIANAFVRTFHQLFKEAGGRIQWGRYIRQYRGESERDYGKVMEILREEWGSDRLPETGPESSLLRDAIRSYLIRRTCEAWACSEADLDFRTKDKCRRDAVLLTDVAGARRGLRQGAAGGTVMVVSSSGRLRDADQAFRSELGLPDCVLSTAALGCLLLLVPGVPMGLSTLRGVLFDVGLAERLSPVQRYAYRLIVGSGQFNMPYAKRVTLQRELGSILLEEARAHAKPMRNLRDRVLKSEDPEYSAKIISTALQRMAVRPETAQELDRLRREVAQLREELEAAKAARGRKGPAQR